MTDLPDLMQATQDAMYGALAAGMPASLSPVFQHVPQNTQPPMTIVGDIEAGPGETKGSEEHTVEIEYVFRGQGRAGLLAIMHRGRTLLEAAPLEAEGADLGRAVWLSSHTERLDDGVTYAGLQRFSVSAEQA